MAILKVNPSKLDITSLFEAISKLAYENCQVFSNIVIENDDLLDYHKGLSERALTFSNDIHSVLKYSQSTKYTSLMIIGRCVYEDYLTSSYIEASASPANCVIELASDAIKQQFDKFKILVRANQNYHNDGNPVYMTESKREETIKKFVGIGNNQKYIDRIIADSPLNVKFRSFKNIGEIATFLDSTATTDKYLRAYYFFRYWSGIAHFSSFEYKVEQDIGYESFTLNSIQEMGAVLVKNIQICMRYFFKAHQIAPIDSQQLIEKIFS